MDPEPPASAHNAVKHGLTGAGKCLPPALAARRDRIRDAYRATFPATDPVTAELVEELALASARREFCLELESAMADDLARTTPAEREAVARDAAERLFGHLAARPARTVAGLRTTAAGCDRLARALRARASRLDASSPWTSRDTAHLADLLGIDPDDRPGDPRLAWFAARLGPVLSTPESRAEVRARLTAEAESLESLARDMAARTARHDALDPLVALWLEHPPAFRTLKRYEAAAHRAVHRCLHLLLKLHPDPSPAPPPATAAAPPHHRRPGPGSDRPRASDSEPPRSPSLPPSAIGSTPAMPAGKAPSGTRPRPPGPPIPARLIPKAPPPSLRRARREARPRT